MLHIEELMDATLLDEMIDTGYINVRQHKDTDLRLLCYTKNAQIRGEWNDATINCRGLVINREGYVVSRPFKKFFNHNEQRAPKISLNDRVYVNDKLDGSLIIAFYYEGGVYYTTKGFFYSDQAEWAKSHMQEFYPNWRPAEGVTYMFEAIYPQNKIVLDYGRENKMVFLGAIHNETDGFYVPHLLDYPGPKAEKFGIESFADALALQPRKNAEGIIVLAESGEHAGERVKIKQQDYIELHRTVFGLNERIVWDHVVEDFESHEDLLSPWMKELPEEFYDWTNEIVNELWYKFNDLHEKVNVSFQDIMWDMEEMDRKEFARRVMTDYPDVASYLFLMLDKRYEKMYREMWESFRPRRDTRPGTREI